MARTLTQPAGTDTSGSARRSLRLVQRLVLAAVAATVATSAGVAASPAGAAVTAAPASSSVRASYTYVATDQFAFWDGSRSVYTRGAVDTYAGSTAWYDPTLVVRSQVAKGSYVILARTGCLWVKVSYTKLTGTVSWPPSGSANTVSDGYYRSCGPKGTYVWLSGISHASRALLSTTVCIGYSDYRTYTLRRYDACKRMIN